MAASKRPRRRLWSGVVTGGLLAGPLCAFFFFGERAVGVPFPPTWLFESLPTGLRSRAPAEGPVHLSVSLGLFVAVCSVLGALCFAMLYRLRTPRARSAGLILSTLVVAALSLLPSALAFRPSVWSVAWILVGAGAWTGVTAFIQKRLHATHVSEGWATVSSADRRRVLVRLAVASAGMTLLGLAMGRRAPTGPRATTPGPR